MRFPTVSVETAVSHGQEGESGSLSRFRQAFTTASARPGRPGREIRARDGIRAVTGEERSKEDGMRMQIL